MGETGQEADNAPLTISPYPGVGWQTVLSRRNGDIVRQLRLFGVALPVRRRIPHSEVVRVASVCRESWWSRAGGFLVFPRNLASSGEGTRVDRTPMPTRGWRYDIWLTLKGGKTIRIETVRSPGAAKELEEQLRRRLGLPEAY